MSEFYLLMAAKGCSRMLNLTTDPRRYGNATWYFDLTSAVGTSVVNGSVLKLIIVQ
jgi:hypothetical protein